jgi:hypothetical protein
MTMPARREYADACHGKADALRGGAKCKDKVKYSKISCTRLNLGGTFRAREKPWDKVRLGFGGGEGGDTAGFTLMS